MADELDAAEVEQFRKWKEGKESRKVKSTGKRKALTELKKMHKADYDKLVKQYGG